VHSRRVSRDALKADNQIEPHAVRLGMTRWAWHPVLSYRVMRLATWEGGNRPKAAIALLDAPAVPAALSPPAGMGDSGSDKQGGTLSPPPPAWQSMPPGGDKAAAILRDNPRLTNAEVAELAGLRGTRTVTRARKTIDRSTT
jgi:hypothetical protein